MTSQIRVDSIVPTTGVPTGGGGGIIQVVSVAKTDTEILSSTTTETLIPDMEATINLHSASNKVLVMVTLWATTGASFLAQYAVLKRGSDNICRGDAAGSRNRATINFGAPTTWDDNNNGVYGPGCISVTHLDSPTATGATTYGLYHADADGLSNALYINRSALDNNSNNFNRLVSSITLMEVSG